MTDTPDELHIRLPGGPYTLIPPGQTIATAEGFVHECEWYAATQTHEELGKTVCVLLWHLANGTPFPARP